LNLIWWKAGLDKSTHQINKRDFVELLKLQATSNKFAAAAAEDV
jgi:hypothetical protein